MNFNTLLAVIGIFAFVAATTGAATSWWLTVSAPGHRRLRKAMAGADGGILVQAAVLSDVPDPRLSRLRRLIPRSPKDMSLLQRRLTKAGYPGFVHVVIFALVELALPVILGLAVVAAFGLRNGTIPGLMMAVLGFCAPGIWVQRKIAQRQKLIQNGLPDALDLLTVCVEAGSGLDQALAKAADELQITHPALADELRLVVTETRAGKSRRDSFRNFAQRTGVDDVRALVSMLAQTDRFGTSIADALRIQADTSRTRRRQRAEERANKVGVKLVFPLALCLFPALYVVCFGPVVVRVYRAFF
jgi:tight adherence protein C